MIFSFHDGWDEMIRIHPSITRLFAIVVLPLSLLPPAMIVYAAGRYGDIFALGVSTQQWYTAAGIFFVAELLTVPAMAWLIHLILTRAYDVRAEYHECFTLAAIAPIPLWLSSLALFVPSLAFNVVIGILALFGSTGLIYHGVYTLFHMRENLQAFQMATVIAGTELFAWLVLMQFVLIH